MVVLLSLWLYQRNQKKLIKLSWLDGENTLNKALLTESAQALETLSHAWDIHENDIILEKKIDEGSFGEVYRAIYREMPVAVKRIKMASCDEIDEERIAGIWLRKLLFNFMLYSILLIRFFLSYHRVMFCCGCFSHRCTMYACR